MANLTTSADIKADILYHGGEPTDGTSDFDAKVLDWLNMVYRDLFNGGGMFLPEVHDDWWWTFEEDIIILQPKYETGTIAVTNNSATITFSSAPAISLAGYHFKVDGDLDVFKISAHTAATTTATLDSVYTGDTDAAASYKAFLVDYDLNASAQYIINPMRTQRIPSTIDGIDVHKFEESWPLHNIQSGAPTVFTMLDEDTVRFNRYGGITSTELIRIDYRYKKLSTNLADDSNEPEVPITYRHLLVPMTLFFLYKDKNDPRATTEFDIAKNGLAGMLRDHRRRLVVMSNNFGKIIPRPDRVIADTRQILRTESGVIIG